MSRARVAIVNRLIFLKRTNLRPGGRRNAVILTTAGARVQQTIAKKLEELQVEVLALEEEARAAGLQLEGDDTVESENGEGDDGCEPHGDGMLMEVDTNGPAAQ